MTLVYVAIGGAFGSVLRHLVAQAFGAPWAIMGINILGSFLIGMAWVILMGRGHLSPLVITGILGGFTTFSSFSLDALKLWEAGRFAEAALYTGGSVLISLVAVTLGATLARSLA